MSRLLETCVEGRGGSRPSARPQTIQKRREGLQVGAQGLALTGLNIVLNVVLVRGLGPIRALGTAGAALGTVLAAGLVTALGVLGLFRGGWVVAFHRGLSWRPDWQVIRSLFRFGLPAGVQGVAMNVAGVLLMRFIGSLEQSAEAQAAYAVGYIELFSFVTWSSVGLMGATAAVAGQNLGAGRPERAARAPEAASRLGLGLATGIGLLFLAVPRVLLAGFGMRDPVVVGIGTELLGFLSVSGLFITVALAYTGALQGTGDTRSPLYISVVSQIAVPLGTCVALEALRGLRPADIWLAILLGHAVRCGLSVARFRQGNGARSPRTSVRLRPDRGTGRLG